jgi:hypothetical protein
MAIRLPKSHPALAKVMICSVCGVDCERKGPTQKYCEACSSARSRQRANKWASENPAPADKIRRWNRMQRSRYIVAGSKVSALNRWSLDEVFPDESGMAWVRRLSIPFTYALSKNHVYKIGGDGHVSLRRETRAARAMLANDVKLAVSDVAVVENKVWIDILVEKPDHRGDAINVLDCVVDGIKDGLGIDDRWYSVRRVDWRIVKIEPRVLIGLGQESDYPVRVCSYCGRLLPYSFFGLNKSMRNGVRRECTDCLAPGRARVSSRP